MASSRRLAWRTLLATGSSALLLAASAASHGQTASYTGDAVRIGQGEAHTVVRTGAKGELVAIGIVMTAAALEGLPTAPAGGHAVFPYPLPMPTKGPKTVVDHVVIDWEAAGHPPPGVYDVPHFDFHFYLVSRENVMQVRFDGPGDSAAPGQQPPPELMPAGYVLPPGTAVPQMGVHAVNPGAPEFQQQPFTATFIYGYYNKRQTFIEPMASLAFLKSKPAFTGPVTRPAAYSKAGAYPSTYRISFDERQQTYEIMLEDLQ